MHCVCIIIIAFLNNVEMWPDIRKKGMEANAIKCSRKPSHVIFCTYIKLHNKNNWTTKNEMN